MERDYGSADVEVGNKERCCTHRRLNFPDTVAGITVFAPVPENAPSMPWSESDGFLILPMRSVALSSELAIAPPAALSRSATE